MPRTPATVTADLRRRNLATVMTLLHQRGALRRAEITQRSGLNKSTVLSLVDELCNRGLATESTAVSNGSRGRPSAVVQANGTDVVTVVSEIAVDFARLAVVGLGGNVLESIDVDVSPRKVGPIDTARALGEAGVNLVVPGQAVVASATAVHGVVSPEGQLLTAPNLDWHNLDLAALTEPFLPAGLPSFFANDADLGALGEQRRGAALGLADVLYLSAERGIGGGLIRDGQLQRGERGHGTEIGHFVVRRGGDRCACGSRGCLETEIGAAALLRKAARRGNPRRVVELAQSGDARARSAVTDVASWLGFAIGNFANLFDPSIIVVGGFLSEIVDFCPDVVADEAQSVAQLRGDRPLPISTSDLGRNAALIGAAELAFDHLLQDPASLATQSPQQESA